MYTNADTLTNKLEELSIRVADTKPDIICVTEVYPKNKKSETQEIELELSGYTMFHTDSPKRGVIMYLANHLIGYQIKLESEFEENVVCKVVTNNKEELVLAAIYRSPESKADNNDKLNDLLSELNDTIKWKHLCIVGDFNYKEINWETNEVSANQDHSAYKTYDTINDLFLHENVRQPTRFRNNQIPSALDWVLTDKEDSITHLEVTSPIGKSDHAVITFNINVATSYDSERTYHAYYKGNYENIRQDMSQIDWHTETASKNIDESWNFFHNKLSGAIERHIPKLKYKSNKKPQWLNKETKIAIKAKHKAWNKYKKTPTSHNWEDYKNHRNTATNKINEAKSNYETRLAEEVKTNPKGFWAYVKSKTKSKGGIRELKDENNTLITQDTEKAETLNKYFTSVFTSEDELSIPLAESKTKNYITDIEINEDIVLSHLNKLNTSKSPGPDNIHTKVISEAKECLVVPLSIIYNKSMAENKLPTQWKEAHITPIFKKGNRSKVSNYRPVSLTSVCCKILETIIRTPLFEHLEKNGLLSKDQHGFREKRSCITQLLEVMEIWVNIFDKGVPWDAIYMDFAKAFDRVPHNRLLSKARSLGIRGNLLKWIADFLDNRKQRVVLEKGTSNWAPVTSGIPQGSVLGPILFIIFINDLPQEIKSYIKIFADDTKIFRAIRSMSDINNLQEDINKLVNWTIKWQLYFNNDKCKVIHYGPNNPNHKYLINNTELQIDSEEKDLGITFNNTLTFSNHIRQICSKANSRVGLIKKPFKNHSKQNIKLLHKSLVRPLLEYGSVIWSPHLKKEQAEIEKVQKRITKLVPKLRHHEYKDRLKALNLTTLEYRRKRADVIQIFRMIKGFDNLNQKDFFEIDTNSRTRGHRYKIIKTHCRTNKKLHSFPHRVINLWNTLPNEAVENKTINSFKSAIEKHWAKWELKYELK